MDPQFPERIYKTHAGVTAIDFSTEFPNFLAVGMYDGVIAIYDVSKDSPDPIISTKWGWYCHQL